MISVVIPIFRDVANALVLIDALSHQHLPKNTSLEIIAVDDGSGDGTSEALRRHPNGMLRIITLEKNHGRAAARNAGAAHANGEYLAFIDCDCLPVGRRLLLAHLHTLSTGSAASCGHVTGVGDGFWSRYQEDASTRRARLHGHGISCAGSSQNIAVRRNAFEQIGGFDAQYVEYGFEDRDLLLRLTPFGNISWCADAVVRHLDELTLEGVLHKMHQAGGKSAERFSRDHPGAYRNLSYSSLDTRLHPWLRPLCFALRPLLGTAPAIDRLLKWRVLPYPIGKLFVRLLSGLAFATGSKKP